MLYVTPILPLLSVCLVLALESERLGLPRNELGGEGPRSPTGSFHRGKKGAPVTPQTPTGRSKAEGALTVPLGALDVRAGGKEEEEGEEGVHRRDSGRRTRVVGGGGGRRAKRAKGPPHLFSFQRCRRPPRRVHFPRGTPPPPPPCHAGTPPPPPSYFFERRAPGVGRTQG